MASLYEEVSSVHINEIMSHYGFEKCEDDPGKIKKIDYAHSRNTLTRTIDQLRRDKLTDCILVSREGLEVPVHKAVLSGCRHLWNILLAGECCHGRCRCSGGDAVVLMPDVPYRVLTVMVKFLYTGVLSYSESDRELTQDVLFQMLGIPRNTVMIRHRDGHVECPNCGYYLPQSDLLNHLIDSHVRIPCNEDLQEYETKKDLRSSMSCSECRARSLDPYWVQYLDEDTDRENFLEHYKSLHYTSYCKYVRDTYSVDIKDEDTRFDREVRNKVYEAQVLRPFQTRADYDDMMGETVVKVVDQRLDEDNSGSYSGRLSSTEDEMEPGKCQYCQRTFTRLEELEEHRNFMCGVCDSEMAQCTLEEHAKIHESPGVSGRVRDIEGIINEQVKSVKRKLSNKDLPPSSIGQTPPQNKKRKESSGSTPITKKRRKKKRRSEVKSNAIIEESDSGESTKHVKAISSKSESKKLESTRSRHSSGPNSQVKKQKKCLKCNKLIESPMFDRHIVTHIKERWTEEEVPKNGSNIRICPRGCGKKIQGWARLINHLAVQHGELVKKLKDHGESLSDYECQAIPLTGEDQVKLDIKSTERSELLNMHNLPESDLATIPPKDVVCEPPPGKLLDVLCTDQIPISTGVIEMDNAELDQSQEQNLDLPNGFDRGGGDDDTDSDRTDPWPEDVGEQDEEDIDIHDNTIN